VPQDNAAPFVRHAILNSSLYGKTPALGLEMDIDSNVVGIRLGTREESTTAATHSSHLIVGVKIGAKKVKYFKGHNTRERIYHTYLVNELINLIAESSSLLHNVPNREFQRITTLLTNHKKVMKISRPE